MTAVDEVFRWARIHAVRHMVACEQAQLPWGETTITEIVTSRVAESVSVVPFTQRAEALSGADWAWWWVDAQGAYGMLVQAKRLRITEPQCSDGRRWKFDFGYPNGRNTQRSTLMTSAASLGLLPVYALYLGSAAYRYPEPCPDSHHTGRCLPCVRRAISLMPALLAESDAVDDASSTYERSVALEDLLAPSTMRAPIIPPIQTLLSPRLEEFLTKPQNGTRAVTRKMIDGVLRVRSGHFRGVTAGVTSLIQPGADDRPTTVFDSVPIDAGHWGNSYFRHVLAPLLREPPAYVWRIMQGDIAGEDLASTFPDHVAGIVVAQPGGESSPSWNVGAH